MKSKKIVVFILLFIMLLSIFSIFAFAIDVNGTSYTMYDLYIGTADNMEYEVLHNYTNTNMSQTANSSTTFLLRTVLSTIGIDIPWIYGSTNDEPWYFDSNASIVLEHFNDGFWGSYYYYNGYIPPEDDGGHYYAITIQPLKNFNYSINTILKSKLNSIGSIINSNVNSSIIYRYNQSFKSVFYYNILGTLYDMKRFGYISSNVDVNSMLSNSIYNIMCPDTIIGNDNYFNAYDIQLLDLTTFYPINFRFGVSSAFNFLTSPSNWAFLPSSILSVVLSFVLAVTGIATTLGVLNKLR